MVAVAAVVMKMACHGGYPGLIRPGSPDAKFFLRRFTLKKTVSLPAAGHVATASIPRIIVLQNESVADPDFELRRGPGFGLLALPAFLPSVISSFFTQNKGGRGGGGGAGPLRLKLYFSVFIQRRNNDPTTY